MTAADLRRIPALTLPEGWRAPFGWELRRHPADAVLTLEANLALAPSEEPLLAASVVLTSYDFEDRSDEQLAAWANRQVAERTADAVRVYRRRRTDRVPPAPEPARGAA